MPSGHIARNPKGCSTVFLPPKAWLNWVAAGKAVLFALLGVLLLGEMGPRRFFR